MLKTRNGFPVWVHVLWIKAVVLLAAGFLLLLDSQTALTHMAALPAKLGLIFPPGRGTSTVDTAAWKVKDFVAMNRRFDAVNTNFPKDVIKAVAWCESEWSHLDRKGKVFHTVNYHPSPSGGWRTSLDWGLMQINERMESLDRSAWDWERIKSDPEYNLRAGLAILEGKRAYVRALKRRKDWKDIEARYDLKGHSDLEITLKAYNGFRRSWSYLYRIQNALVERPWEKAMLQQMFAAANHPEVSCAYVGERPLRTTGALDNWSLRVCDWDRSGSGGAADSPEQSFYRLNLSRR